MIASWFLARRHRQFLAACEQPRLVQASRLRRILTQAADTEFGRDHQFAALARLDDSALVPRFQAQVPIRTYGQMRADLDLVEAGHWRRLCPSQPRFFAMTAGSTGQHKKIPITEEFRRETAGATQAFAGALEAHYPELRGLKTQFLVGSADGGLTSGGVPQGYMSGYNYRHLPWLVRRRFVLPYWVFTLPDAADRAYAAGRLLIEERRLGAIAAISPVNLINVMVALQADPGRLFRDLIHGTVTLGDRTSCGRVPPNPALALELGAARDREGRFPPRLLFPSLRVLVCWQGGSMGYYLRELDDLFQLDQHFELPISASEGLFAVPHRANRPGGIAAITGHFLEFLPDDGTDDLVTALTVDQLIVGATYRLVITTSGGLYRYDMEDLVQVTGYYRQTPIIEFVAKADRRVSVANERITELDVTVAMEAASRSTGQWFRHFRFVPCSDRRYRVLVDGAIALSSLEAFSAELDRQLRLTAVGYDFERDDDLLAPLEVVVTAPGALDQPPPGTDHRLPNAQIKPVHLATRFDEHLTFLARAPHATLDA